MRINKFEQKKRINGHLQIIKAPRILEFLSSEVSV